MIIRLMENKGTVRVSERVRVRMRVRVSKTEVE